MNAHDLFASWAFLAGLHLGELMFRGSRSLRAPGLVFTCAKLAWCVIAAYIWRTK